MEVSVDLVVADRAEEGGFLAHLVDLLPALIDRLLYLQGNLRLRVRLIIALTGEMGAVVRLRDAMVRQHDLPRLRPPKLPAAGCIPTH